MLLFQQVEHILKFLVANGCLSGYASELNKIQEQNAASVHKQTMGQLVKQLVENTYSERVKITDDPLIHKEAHFAFSFQIESDTVYEETKKKTLASIVADRNEFVHHLLPSFKPDSIESCLEVDQLLDQQRE